MSGRETRPVDDTPIARMDDVAVGSDLGFQRKWWRFEGAVWFAFTCVVLLDLSGAFGQGTLAHARAQTGDRALTVDYDRIARFGAPSMVTVRFGAPAVRNGRVQLWTGDSLLKALGVERFDPQPESAALDRGGLLLAFPSMPQADSIQFALQPRGLGFQKLRLRVPHVAELTVRIFVVP